MPISRRQTTLASMLWAAGLLGGVPSAQAGFIPIDFSSQHNFRIQNRFPSAPAGNVTLAGVPFQIPVTGNNEWMANGVGENFDPANNGTHTIVIAVGIPGVQRVFSLANTMWGQPGGGRMLVEFFGSGGAYYSRDLVGNSDIRDWNTFFTSAINGTTTVVAFEEPNGRDNNPDYLDMQIYDLPVAFLSEELARIVITDQSLAGVHVGVLTGLTVEAVPEPSAWALVALGGGLIGLRRRARR